MKTKVAQLTMFASTLILTGSVASAGVLPNWIKIIADMANTGIQHL